MKEEKLTIKQLKFIYGLGLLESKVCQAITEAQNETDLATGLYLLVSSALHREQIKKIIAEPDLEALGYMNFEILHRRNDQ